MMNEPVHVTDAAFERVVLQSTLPVVVDFWAPWCGPCRMVAPTLDKLAKEYAGKLIIAKVNTDENSDWAMKYGVQESPPCCSLPMVKSFKDRWALCLNLCCASFWISSFLKLLWLPDRNRFIAALDSMSIKAQDPIHEKMISIQLAEPRKTITALGHAS
jgi:thioredoxin